MSDKVKQIILLVIIGLLTGLMLFRLSSQGKLSFKLPASSSPSSSVSPASLFSTTETRTVVQEESAIINVVDKSSSSVIAIGVTQRIFNPFDPNSVPSQRQSTIGTGFVVSTNVLVTNRHVVADANTKYTVVSKDGKKYDVAKIYRDPNLDLALVQVSGGDDLKPLPLGDSSRIKIGQTAIAIGNALGRFDNTVTTGVISGVGRAVNAGDPFSGEIERLDNLIQTDAAINPGNSGGPLLNTSGEVIGVNVATTEGAQNIGFAIPINSVKTIVEEFVKTGTVSRPYLGVRYRLITRDIAILNEIPQGAYIQEVLSGSPADKAGIKSGDIITKIDGKNVNTDTTISETIQNKKVGDGITIEVWSEGNNRRTVTATLAESPTQ